MHRTRDIRAHLTGRLALIALLIFGLSVAVGSAQPVAAS